MSFSWHQPKHCPLIKEKKLKIPSIIQYQVWFHPPKNYGWHWMTPIKIDGMIPLGFCQIQGAGGGGHGLLWDHGGTTCKPNLAACCGLASTWGETKISKFLRNEGLHTPSWKLVAGWNHTTSWGYPGGRSLVENFQNGPWQTETGT